MFSFLIFCLFSLSVQTASPVLIYYELFGEETFDTDARLSYLYGSTLYATDPCFNHTIDAGLVVNNATFDWLSEFAWINSTNFNSTAFPPEVNSTNQYHQILEWNFEPLSFVSSGPYDSYMKYWMLWVDSQSDVNKNFFGVYCRIRQVGLKDRWQMFLLVQSGDPMEMYIGSTPTDFMIGTSYHVTVDSWFNSTAGHKQFDFYQNSVLKDSYVDVYDIMDFAPHPDSNLQMLHDDTNLLVGHYRIGAVQIRGEELKYVYERKLAEPDYNMGIGLIGVILMFLSWFVAWFEYKADNYGEAFLYWLVLFVIGFGLFTVLLGG